MRRFTNGGLKVLTFLIPIEMYQELKLLSARSGVSLAEYARAGVQHELDEAAKKENGK